MADDDGSRRPSQPSTPLNPAGVGSSVSNRGSPGMVSPTILREILESGDQGLIDDAFDQWTTADMGHLLETLLSERPPQELAARPPTALQVLVFLVRPRVLWAAPVEAEEEDLHPGPPGPRLDLAVDVVPLHQGESARLHQGVVVRLQFLSEPVPHEDDPGKLKKSHAAVNEDEEHDLHVPTRRRPSRGPDPGPRRKSQSS